MTADDSPAWVPAGCALPTAEQPLRVAEFDALFADAVRTAERPSARTLVLVIDPQAEGRARELAERESDCCSFFDFSFAPADDHEVRLSVSVPSAHASVLDALAERVTASGAP